MNIALSQNIWLPYEIPNGTYGKNLYGLTTVIIYDSQEEAIYLNLNTNTNLTAYF